MSDAGEPPQPRISTEPARQRPWDKDIRVPLPAGSGFTESEHWAWSKIVRGEIADMRFATGKDDGAGADANEEAEGEGGKKALKPWPDSRKLSARFFETILFHEPWASASAKPWVRIQCAWMAEELDWENAHFSGEIGLWYCRFDKNPNFMGLRIGRLLNFQGTRLAQGIRADGLQIEGALFFRRGFRAEGEVRLVGARIGSNVDFGGATLTQGLGADGIRVEGSLYCREGFKADGKVRLLRAHIGGDLQLLGAFDGLVNLTGATIVGELQFDQGGTAQPTWGDNVRLVLRNVSCGALGGKIESFRRANAKGKRALSVPVDLLGLSYSRIGGLAGPGVQAGATLADASAKELIAFLQSDAPRNGIFTPQPYRQLADALMAAGREEKAHQIRFALLEHERLAKGVPLTRKAALFLSRHLIGHGFENWRATIGFALVVLATAAIGLWYQGHPFVTAPAAMDFRAMGDWGGYALGNSIPLLELDPAHKTFVQDRFGATAPLGLKTWLYSFKLLGFVMLSYLAAGLSGFASRSARG